MHCPDCDFRIIAENLRISNKLGGCPSESMAYAEFIMSLVGDPDIMTIEDGMALWDAYAEPNPPAGKLFKCYIYSL